MEINDRIKNIVAAGREKEFKEAENIIKKTRDSLSRKFAAVEEVVKQGDPSEEILDIAGELNADIIAVGGGKMTGIKGILGSVSRYILNHSNCAVLIGKA
jgi:nucleotide-binding universal stress UspA family protein